MHGVPAVKQRRFTRSRDPPVDPLRLNPPAHFLGTVFHALLSVLRLIAVFSIVLAEGFVSFGLSTELRDGVGRHSRAVASRPLEAARSGKRAV